MRSGEKISFPDQKTRMAKFPISMPRSWIEVMLCGDSLQRLPKEIPQLSFHTMSLSAGCDVEPRLLPDQPSYLPVFSKQGHLPESLYRVSRDCWLLCATSERPRAFRPTTFNTELQFQFVPYQACWGELARCAETNNDTLLQQLLRRGRTLQPADDWPCFIRNHHSRTCEARLQNLHISYSANTDTILEDQSSVTSVLPREKRFHQQPKPAQKTLRRSSRCVSHCFTLWYFCFIRSTATLILTNQSRTRGYKIWSWNPRSGLVVAPGISHSHSTVCVSNMPKPALPLHSTLLPFRFPAYDVCVLTAPAAHP